MSARRKPQTLLLIGGGADEVDVSWAAGFTAPDPFLFLQHGEEKHVLVSLLELGRARRVPGLHAHTPDDLGMDAATRRSYGAQALALLRKLRLRSVGVSPRCPVGIVREIEAAGLKVQVAKDPIFPGRLLKTEDEIHALRLSQRAAVAAMNAATTLIAASAPGRGRRLEEGGKPLTSERVRARIEQALLEHNCIGEDIIVAGGDQGVDPHERGHGTLFAGQPIVLDIFPRSRASGYWGDITRTVIRGPASPEQQRLYATVLRAQSQALRAVKPGVTGADIHAGVCAVFEQAGYRSGRIDGVPQGFIHSTGHGVGLEIHEGPSVSPSGGVLEPGHVITIEPGLYYPGLGGMRIEDTVVVTARGSSLLATCPKVFEI